jgi:protein-disulfide isomerase
MLSRCAGLQNKFWEMNEYLFGLGARSEGLEAAALKQRMTDGVKELGLDVAQIDQCLKDPSTKEKILADIRDGDAAGLEGTPLIFINGKRVRDISYDNLANIFEDILGPLPQ